MTKAYQVQCEEEGNAIIVFADSEDSARFEASSEVRSAYTSATRKPEYDQYSGLGYVPQNILISDGWWFECHHCGQEMCHDSHDDEEINLEDVIYHRNAIYCNKECRLGHLDEINKSNSCFTDFCELVKKLRPDLEFYKFEGEYPMITKRAHFQFSGSNFGGSVSIQDFRESSALEWSLAQGDMGKWEEYEINLSNFSEHKND